MTYLNFISDQYAGFSGLVIPGTLRDSVYILEGLLQNDTSLRPVQIMTDTASYSDLVFGLFRLLGRYAPEGAASACGPPCQRAFESIDSAMQPAPIPYAGSALAFGIEQGERLMGLLEAAQRQLTDQRPQRSWWSRLLARS